MATVCCPKSVKACAVRFTRLQPNGLPYSPLTSNRSIQGSGFAELLLSPDYDEGDTLEVRSPGGELAVMHREFDALRGFEVSLKLCGFSLLAEAIGVNLLVDDAGDVPGMALADTLSDGCLDPWMVEVWSKNATRSTDVEDCARWVHWVLPFTSHWRLASDLAFTSGALEWEISGYARQSEWWFPAYPGPTFPSYDPMSGFPEGPAPQTLPLDVPADEWSLDDWATIRQSGPLAWKCVSALPSPLDDCAYMPSCPTETWGEYDSAVYGFDVYSVPGCS